jgi:hypothetical protein
LSACAARSRSRFCSVMSREMVSTPVARPSMTSGA